MGIRLKGFCLLLLILAGLVVYRIFFYISAPGFNTTP
jgi:hypothetical protein